MEKNGSDKYIFLNTFRSQGYILSSESNVYHYMIGSKICYGNFVVYCSKNEFKPTISDALNDEDLSINDIKPLIKSTGIYFPIYLKNKIGNARKKGKENVKKVIGQIVEDYDKYYNLYKEDELYSIIAAFFDLVYEELLQMNKKNKLKIIFQEINNVEPLFSDKKNWNSELVNSYYISKEFLKQLGDNKIINNIFSNLIGSVGTIYTIDFKLKNITEVQNIRSSIYNLLYNLGLPYIINSELGDTIHLKNDFIANCYDSFFIIGILIEMIKKINYPIETNKYEEVLSVTNLPKMKKKDLENILKDIILSEYEFISKITNIENKEITIDFGTDTKTATSINNLLDFYYHYFFNHLEDKTFKKNIKQEELNKFKRSLKKENYRSDKLSYIRQLKQQQLDYKNFNNK